ncbi:MAG TPA: hypothetical protein VME20_03965 [Acidimicrobiales bacterium]|nr:hypothetical protein [Acidimicrobiales bacterium]
MPLETGAPGDAEVRSPVARRIIGICHLDDLPEPSTEQARTVPVTALRSWGGGPC